MMTEDYLAERARRSSRDKFEKALAKVAMLSQMSRIISNSQPLGRCHKPIPWIISSPELWKMKTVRVWDAGSRANRETEDFI